MPVDTSSIKSNFISSVVAQAQAIKAANANLIALLVAYQNQYGPNQSDMLVDADFQGSNDYMTAAQLAQFFAAVQPAIAAAVANNEQALLPITG